MGLRKLSALKAALAIVAISLLVSLPQFAAQQKPEESKNQEESKGTGQKNGSAQSQSEAVTFKDISAIFKEQKCIVCHRGENPSGLDLTEPVAYKNLVNAKSTQDPESILVKPGDPDASYLFVKLNGPGKDGTVMPPKGKLPQELIDKVAAWIKGGAKNN